jgi:TonB family protein
MLSTLRHWSPAIFLSLIANFGSLKLFEYLIATAETAAPEKNRLNVHLVQATPQEQIAPPKSTPKSTPKPTPTTKPIIMPEPVKSPEPGKRVSEKPAPKKPLQKPKSPVKPPAPKKVAQAKKNQPPRKSEESSESIKTPTHDKEEHSVQQQVKMSKPEEEQSALSPPPVPQAPRIADVVPLFRLTRPPKMVSFNPETLERFYPEEEREFGKEATVEAMIEVDESGNIVEVEIIKSAGARFDAAAKKVLLSKALVIQPGYIGDEPVVTRVSIPITFNLTH